ncbi:transcription factor Adf-1-like isoform X1 [Bactrocera tryoni]|uniref:transcription factor Adf-1-like isoform X1 n=1 Tax=Bactrocera tryoni TaxID=59916 RepID=UPI001A974782|nr:transcription factor Adf-1-like isoform X1 [Bactrocera tryoni]
MDSNAYSMKQPSEHYKPYGRARTDIKNKKTLKEDKTLCNLVKQHPQLYDEGHKGYSQKKATDEAWHTIAESLGKSVPECKERWRNIRAAYARSIDDYKTKRGKNRGRQYYLAKEMEFLKPHKLKEVTQNNKQNNRINNSEAGANENDETYSLAMCLIDSMDKKSLRDLELIIDHKLRQIVATKTNKDNELSAPMQ